MTKQEYVQLLQNNILLVTFIKKDGTKRELKCTLKPNIIEAYYSNHSKPTSVRKSNDLQVSAVDIELNEFRSFLVDSVIDYKII
jgi:hypothetical protein